MQKKDGTEVTRLNVWVKSRTKKDGTAVNTDAADKIVILMLFSYSFVMFKIRVKNLT